VLFADVPDDCFTGDDRYALTVAPAHLSAPGRDREQL
jgi:hypothetical protein